MARSISCSVALTLAALLSAPLLGGCSQDVGPSEESRQVTAPLEGAGQCWVLKNGSPAAQQAVDSELPASFDQCREVAFRVGDQYCNDLRAGASGPNPVTLYYEDNNAYSDTWVFGCEGVPERR